MQNWVWMHENSSLAYLYKDETKHEEGFKPVLGQAWMDIQQSYLDRYGLEYTEEKIIKLKLKFLKEVRNFIKHKKPIHRQNCKVIQREIEKIQKDNKGVPIMDSVISLELYLNRDLDLSKLTVANYYDKLRYASKHGKGANKS